MTKQRSTEFERRRDKVAEDGSREVVLEEQWHEGFVGEALTLRMSPEGKVDFIEFYHADLGVARWRPGTGLGLVRAWDDDSEEAPEPEADTSGTISGVHDEGKRRGQIVIDAVLSKCESAVAEFVRLQLQFIGGPLVFPSALVKE